MIHCTFPHWRIAELLWKETRLLYHGLPGGAERVGGPDHVEQEVRRIRQLLKPDAKGEFPIHPDALLSAMRATEEEWENRRQHAYELLIAINRKLTDIGQKPIPVGMAKNQRIFEVAKRLGYVPSTPVAREIAEGQKMARITASPDPKKMGSVTIKTRDNTDYKVNIENLALESNFTIEQKEQLKVALEARRNELEKDIGRIKNMLCQTIRLCNELARQRYLMQLTCRHEMQKTVGDHVNLPMQEYERQWVQMTLEKAHMQHFLDKLKGVWAVGETRITSDGRGPYRVQYTRSGTEGFAESKMLERLPTPPPRQYEPFSVTRARELANKPPPRPMPQPPDADARAQQLRWRYQGLHTDSWKGRDADPLHPGASKEFRAAADRMWQAQENLHRIRKDRGPWTPSQHAAMQAEWKQNEQSPSPEQQRDLHALEGLYKTFDQLRGLHRFIAGTITIQHRDWDQWRVFKNDFPEFLNTIATYMKPHISYGGANITRYGDRVNAIRLRWQNMYNSLGPKAKEAIQREWRMANAPKPAPVTQVARPTPVPPRAPERPAPLPSPEGPRELPAGNLTPEDFNRQKKFVVVYNDERAAISLFAELGFAMLRHFRDDGAIQYKLSRPFNSRILGRINGARINGDLKILDSIQPDPSPDGKFTIPPRRVPTAPKPPDATPPTHPADLPPGESGPDRLVKKPKTIPELETKEENLMKKIEEEEQFKLTELNRLAEEAAKFEEGKTSKADVDALKKRIEKFVEEMDAHAEQLKKELQGVREQIKELRRK